MLDLPWENCVLLLLVCGYSIPSSPFPRRIPRGNLCSETATALRAWRATTLPCLGVALPPPEVHLWWRLSPLVLLIDAGTSRNRSDHDHVPTYIEMNGRLWDK